MSLSLARLLNDPFTLVDCFVEDALPRELSDKINQFRNGVFHRRETDTHVNYDICLPGVKLENIQVDVNNSVVSISVEEDVEETRNNSYSHHFTGLKRTFKLQPGVSDDSLDASHANGVLTLSYPKVDNDVVNTTRRVKINQ